MIDRPSGKPLPGKSFNGEQSAQVADSLQEVRNELAALIAVLSQFEPVTILTADGRVVIAFAQESGTGGLTGGRRWGLEKEPDEDNSYRINPGIIMYDPVTEATIDNAVGYFTPAAGSAAWLEISSAIGLDTVTVKFGTEPTDLVTVTGSGDTAAMALYRRLLWTFDATDEGFGLKLGTELFANPKCSDVDLKIVSAFIDNPDEPARILSIVALVPF